MLESGAGCISNLEKKDGIVEEEPEEDPEEEIYEEEDPEEDIEDEEPEEDPEEEIEDEEPEEDPEEEIVEGLEKDLGQEINKKFDVREHGSENGVSKVIVNGESSGKRRQSRWDPIQEVEASENEKNSKRRKTRWDINDSQDKLFKQSGLISFFEHSTDPEITRLKLKLMKVCKKLQSPEIYDQDTLIDKRNRILSELTKLNPIVKSLTKKFVKKVFIPEKEYPSYNFIGLILGPKGNTQKKMEKESGARIFLRGKGSGDNASAEEDLHVLVEANDQNALDIAVSMIEKLVIPVADLNNDHKKAQLQELARMRGTYKDHNVCDLCKTEGHKSIACPLRDSTFETSCCDVCGGFGHSPSNCRNKRKMDPGNLYVGYLSHAIDENRLKELFLPFGNIVNAAVIKDRSTGLSKGYGFVQIESPDDAAAAIKYMNGYQMDGKMLVVRIAGQNSVPGPTVPGPLTMGHMPIPSAQAGPFSFPGPTIPVYAPIPSPQVGPFSFLGHGHSPTGPIAGPRPVPGPTIPGHGPVPSAQVGPFSFMGHGPIPTGPIVGPKPLPGPTIPGHVPVPSAQVGPFSFLGHMPSTSDSMLRNNFSSGNEFSRQIPSSLPNAISELPGHRESSNSQFNSFLTNPTMKVNQIVDIGQMPESDQDSNFWSTFRFS